MMKHGRVIRYLVEYYPADGVSYGPDEIYRWSASSLDGARQIVRQRLGVAALRPERRWQDRPLPEGAGGVVESYHERLKSDLHSDGCGGYTIVRLGEVRS